MKNLIILFALIFSTGVFAQDLFEAAKEGDVARIKQLISEGANVDAKDNAGLTALQYAAMNKRIDASKVLLSKKAEITEQIFLDIRNNFNIYELRSLFLVRDDLWGFLNYLDGKDVRLAKKIAVTIIKNTDGSDFYWRKSLTAFMGDCIAAHLYQVELDGSNDLDFFVKERLGRIFVEISEEGVPDYGNDGINAVDNPARKGFKAVVDYVAGKKELSYDKYERGFDLGDEDKTAEYLENWEENSAWTPYLSEPRSSVNVVEKVSNPVNIEKTDNNVVEKVAPQKNAWEAVKALNVLDENIKHAKTTKDIMQLTILFEEIAKQGFESPYFTNALESTTILLDVAARRIENVENNNIIEGDAKAVLCQYVSISADFPNDFITRKALQKMNEDLESNGDVFSGMTLKYMARDNVLAFMAESQLDPLVLGFVKIFKEVLEVEGNTYKKPRYYTDPKFKEVKNSLREIKGVVKK